MKKTSSEYKLFLPLATFYNMLWFLAIFTNATVFEIGQTKISASTLLVVLIFSLNDVITEVYGYLLMKNLIWCTIFNLLIMTLLILMILSIPGLETWPDAQYTEILNQSAFVAITAIISSFISSFMNSFFISKWKVLYSGRYYWCRSAISTAIAAFFFTCIGFTYRIIHLPISESFQFIITAYFIKIVADILFTTPNTIFQYRLKKIENIDIYDRDINYNPFTNSTTNDQ